MDAKRINPILNVSDIRASFAWFEALGWEKALLQSRRPCQIDPLSQPIQPGIARFIIAGFPRINVRANSTILALIFNQPGHGLWEGDLDCWASEDGGATWRFRGRAAQHGPGTNRMNCTAGIAANGDIVVLCSGWTDRRPLRS